MRVQMPVLMHECLTPVCVHVCLTPVWHTSLL
jgi:hypothetical protein